MTEVRYDANVPEHHDIEAPVEPCPVCKDGTAHVVCKDGKIRFTKMSDPNEWDVTREGGSE